MLELQSGIITSDVSATTAAVWITLSCEFGELVIISKGTNREPGKVTKEDVAGTAVDEGSTANSVIALVDVDGGKSVKRSASGSGGDEGSSDVSVVERSGLLFVTDISDLRDRTHVEIFSSNSSAGGQENLNMTYFFPFP